MPSTFSGHIFVGFGKNESFPKKYNTNLVVGKIRFKLNYVMSDFIVQEKPLNLMRHIQFQFSSI